MNEVIMFEDQDKRYFTLTKRLSQLLTESSTNIMLKVFRNWTDGIKYFDRYKDQISLVILDIRMPAVCENELELDRNRMLMPKKNVFRSSDDYNYGEETGYEVFRQIKILRPYQKILFWTVISKSDVEQKIGDLDDESYCSKESGIAKLCAKIDTLLGTEMAKRIEEKLYPIL